MASNRLSKGFVDYYQVHNGSPSGGARERKEGEPVDGTRLPIERIPPTSIFMPPAPPGVSSRGQLTPHGGAPAEFGDTDSDTDSDGEEVAAAEALGLTTASSGRRASCARTLARCDDDEQKVV